MTRRSRNSPGNYQVGYGKPPFRTRFRKGVSGNPSGRPRGMTAGRASTLALNEAYRMVRVREGDKVLTMPAIQAVLRSQVALAAKGNGPAQRAVFAAAQAIEQEQENTMATHEHGLPGGIAERLAEALKRVDGQTGDQVRSDRGTAPRKSRRSGR